jgi:hypothetical protein
MNFCPVCGYQMVYPPNDFHICPSCGTEFGYDDSGVTYAELREQWIATGPAWWSPVDPRPENWDPINQMIRGLFLTPNPILGEISVSVGMNQAEIAPAGSIKRKRARAKRHFVPALARSPYPALLNTAA